MPVEVGVLSIPQVQILLAFFEQHFNCPAYLIYFHSTIKTYVGVGAQNQCPCFGSFIFNVKEFDGNTFINGIHYDIL